MELSTTERSATSRGQLHAHLNSSIIFSRSFCGMSLCMYDTVKLFSFILAASQFT